jgi:serine/threonine protein kinase
MKCGTQNISFFSQTKNILWANQEKTVVKIGDFGLAIKGDYFNGRCGTVPYSAPETFQTHKVCLKQFLNYYFQFSSAFMHILFHRVICTLSELLSLRQLRGF